LQKIILSGHKIQSHILIKKLEECSCYFTIFKDWNGKPHTFI